MPSIPEQGLAQAQKLGLDLGVVTKMVPTKPFFFENLIPKKSMVEGFKRAIQKGLPWIEGMPIPVLVYYPDRDEYRVMDGIMRIGSAKEAGMKEFPALVASGETYDALEPIMINGYYGEDYVEMLSMVDEKVRGNLETRDRNMLSGIR